MRRHVPFVIVILLFPAMLLGQTGNWALMPACFNLALTVFPGKLI